MENEEFPTEAMREEKALVKAIREALSNARENGYPHDFTTDENVLHSMACDLIDCDSFVAACGDDDGDDDRLITRIVLLLPDLLQE